MKFLERSAVVAVAALVMAVVAGCGDDNESGASGQTTGEGQAASSEPPGGYEIGPLSVPARGRGDYVIPGHREDVPELGREAGKRELKQAAANVHGYLVARVEEDWPEACTYVSQELVRRLAARSSQPAGASCEALLGELSKPGPGSEYEMSEVEANALRRGGKRGFLLYSAAAAPYFMPVSREGSRWVVNSLAPTPFYYTSS